jgi:uncharacterized protein YdiU (UPF0061 family)
MSIVGLTIDYGPYGFMDHFDPKHICNHSDTEGRYAYECQPDICMWNLDILRQSFGKFIPYERQKLQETYLKHFTSKYNELMQAKLGLQSN